MNKIRWGILGPGRIATRFMTDLVKLDDAELGAVGSRSLERAKAFASQYGGAKAHGSYADLVRDPDVDIVYVATPHPFHEEHALLCLEHGKAVLCEKPMGINAAQVRRMVDGARASGVFLMEAMWTRFLPVTRQVCQWIADGLIGEARMLTADFGFRTQWNPQGRLLNPDLAGGALLDVGVYVAAFAHMIFGQAPVQIQATGHIGETGVDEQTAMLLGFEQGQIALLSCAVRTGSPHTARIDGAEGSIHIPAFWHSTSAELRVQGKEPITTEGEVGYHYEAAEAMACLRAGKVESEIMPLGESIAIAETLEQARRQIGLRYPME